jgi:hypothetical protein
MNGRNLYPGKKLAYWNGFNVSPRPTTLRRTS